MRDAFRLAAPLALVGLLLVPGVTAAAGQPDDLFVDSGQSLGTYSTLRIGAGDLDGDDDIDIFAAHGGSQPNVVWFNVGDGTFLDSGQRLGDRWSWGLDIGDVDADGDLDAFVGNYVLGQPNEVWLNGGDGFFTDSGQRLGDKWTLAVSLDELNGSPGIDAFVSNFQPNTVWINEGIGTFADSGQSVGPWINGEAALGDLDDDGDLDAFLANHDWTAGAPNHVLDNDGSGLFTDTGQRLGVALTRGVALGDLDGDGDLDAFAANNSANSVWINDGHGVFSDSGQRLGSTISVSVALGDADGDGDLDAFTANTGPNRVWLNEGTGTFVDSGLALGSYESLDVALVDLDADGDLDAYVSNNGGDRVWINTSGPYPREVPIDVKPQSDANKINCSNLKGVIPVALLSTDDFAATDADHTTVSFAGAAEKHTKRGVAKRHVEDVNGDGLPDLMFHFRFRDTNLGCDATEATLSGETYAGWPIHGIDHVKMIQR